MEPQFGFATAGRVQFGAGCSKELPEILARSGTRLLLCTGSRPERYAELAVQIGLPFAVFSVRGEPTVEMARNAADLGREHGADLVAAVGGGSVIDLAKAAAALIGTGGDPLDHLEVVGRGQPVTATVPCIAVPTTAGTGSEVTANAVLSSPEHRVKASLRSPLMLPRVALVDPLLTLGCSPAVTASSGLDALTQCLEPYVSCRATPLTDALATEGLRRAATGLRRAFADGGDVRARTDMALCSLLGGMSLANAKLGAVHALAGVVGGVVDVPHGVACAALLAPVVEANVRALARRQPDSPAAARHVEVARLLTGDPEARVEDGIAWIRETVAALGVPRLGVFGVTPEHSEHVVPAAARASSMQGNPVVLHPDELREALAAAL